MMFLVYGLGLLALFLVLGNVLTRVPAARIAKHARFGGIVVLVGLALLLMLTGRFAAVTQVLALVGRAMHARGLFNRPKGFGDVDDDDGSAPASGSHGPTIQTAYLQMKLDEGSGQIDGKFLCGPFAPRRLSSLSSRELQEARLAMSDDVQSQRLLEAYLDRTFAGWREDHQQGAGARSASPPDAGGMSKDEAYQVLGLEPGAKPDAIQTAHRRLMSNIHPDKGGSSYLGAKVNLAREILMKLHG